MRRICFLWNATIGRGAQAPAMPRRQPADLTPRRAEAIVRVASVAFRRWTRRYGLSRRGAARTLGLPTRTLGHWESRWKIDRLQPRRRGRPLGRSPLTTRNTLVRVVDLLGPQTGVPTLKGLFPRMPRREIADMLRRYRRLRERRRRLRATRLNWTKPGTVWGADYTQPPTAVDQRDPNILSVRDLASGLELAWTPTPDQTAPRTAALLATLFWEHGPPLVLKTDNGSGLRGDPVARLLERSGVVALPSPPRRPQYQGSVEAGIGSLKTRTDYQALCRDPAGSWTSGDLELARQLANHTTRPRRLRGQSPQQCWAARTSIAEPAREAFLETVQRARREAYEEHASKCTRSPVPRDQARLHRLAVRRALVEHGLLHTRRRSNNSHNYFSKSGKH